MIRKSRWSRKVVVAAVAAVAAGAGGIAWASIPDSSGVIHACYATTGGALRVIDTHAGQTCGSAETPLTWNQRGINWQGTWSSATAYAKNDAVASAGSSYLALVPNTNVKPAGHPTTWALLAGKGAAGPAGSARAYATVDANSGSPFIVTTRSKNAVSVQRIGVDYCVFFDPSIDMGSAAPIAGIVLGEGMIYADPGGCSSDGVSGVQVATYDTASNSSDTINFSVLIP